MVQQCHIFRIHQVFNCKVFLCFLDTASCDSCGFCLFINDVVSIFVDSFLILFVIHFYDSGRFQRLGKLVYDTIQCSGLIALSGNDQRRSCFINQDGVHLVHDGKVMTALNLVLFVDDHIVTQIIESEFVVGAICNITRISFPTLVVCQTVENTSNCQTEETQNLSHFIGLCFCQVVIDRYNVNALSGQRIQISCNTCNQSFTFTGLHFGNTPLMQDNCTNDLYRERFFSKDTVSRFTNRRQSLRFHAFQSFAVFQTISEFIGFFFEICIRKSCIFLIQI